MWRGSQVLLYKEQVRLLSRHRLSCGWLRYCNMWRGSQVLLYKEQVRLLSRHRLSCGWLRYCNMWRGSQAKNKCECYLDTDCYVEGCDTATCGEDHKCYVTKNKCECYYDTDCFVGGCDTATCGEDHKCYVTKNKCECYLDTDCYVEGCDTATCGEDHKCYVTKKKCDCYHDTDCGVPDKCVKKLECVKGKCQTTLQEDRTPCRYAEGLCDVTEYCNGKDPECPKDGYASKGTLCRGVSPYNKCDLAEKCDGKSASCPPDFEHDLGYVYRCGSTVFSCGVEKSDLRQGKDGWYFGDTRIGAAKEFKNLAYPACVSQCINRQCPDGCKDELSAIAVGHCGKSTGSWYCNFYSEGPKWKNAKLPYCF
eukprot:TRINITY_DN2083_c0_g1_i2.p1 TRINITY_DN2083_c0_g1~~TRINITY_DN2083_c0_g1_i2.p1  ORF type:complete len:365 (-),score=49.99 TRINITY_DN2083_c0_g1_i2:11-1105(-)